MGIDGTGFATAQGVSFCRGCYFENYKSDKMPSSSFVSVSSLLSFRCLPLWLGAVALLLVAPEGPSPPGAAASVLPAPPHHLTKRSFFDIQCKGVYDKSIFARLDRICEDCYNLFREPQLHSLCRKNCFTTEYFKGCLEALQLTDEMEQIQTWIKQLHGAEPGV